MDLKTLSEWATFSLGPSGYAILFTLVIALTLPLLLHLFLYRQGAATTLPTFLLVGPSGAGKTTLLTLVCSLSTDCAWTDRLTEGNQFERGTPAKTHISQAPLTVECSLPVGTTASSNQYRSVNDPSSQAHQKFLLVDTPGHGKLRHYALDGVVNPQNLKGIIFVVDAATLSANSASEGQGDSSLAESAEYLHDILLALQRRYTNTKASKRAGEIPVLIAANKLDLFTALPARLVKSILEGEISKLRNTRSKGLLDSGIGMDDTSTDEEDKEVLGGGGEGKFEFGLMDEYNVPIQVVGGSAAGSGATAADVSQWWDWIAQHL